MYLCLKFKRKDFNTQVVLLISQELNFIAFSVSIIMKVTKCITNLAAHTAVAAKTTQQETNQLTAMPGYTS